MNPATTNTPRNPSSVSFSLIFLLPIISLIMTTGTIKNTAVNAVFTLAWKLSANINPANKK